MSWLKPPPVVVLAGTEDYLRDRELRKACLAASVSGRDIVHAATGVAAFGAAAHASMFGMETLVVVPASGVSADQVQQHIEAGRGPASVILVVEGSPDEKRYPAIAPVHGSARIVFERPDKASGRRKAAEAFARKEAGRHGGNLPDKLATALVKVVGTDLGRISFEVLKACTLAGCSDRVQVSADDLRDTLHQPTGVDMTGIARALRRRDVGRLLLELDRFASRIGGAPEMLLLRGRGGPADLAMRWLRISSLIESGAGTMEIAERVGIPRWAMAEEESAARRWGGESLRSLVRSLAHAESATLKGAPAPWIHLCSALAREAGGLR